MSIEELLNPRYKVIAEVASGTYSVCDEGYVLNNKTGRRLKTYVNKKDNGYEYVKLQNGDKQISFHVGVLVGKAFVPNPENKPTINHEDGNKLNNHYTNLKWATHKENSIHAFQNGLGKSGFDHYSSKFSQEDFWEIKMLHDRGLKNFEIARLYNVSETAIRNLVLGNSYKHVTAPNSDLFTPRFKVKIDYPFSTFKVGEVITTGENSFLCRTLINFPEIFTPLSWWEERKESEMPEYIKRIAKDDSVSWLNIEINEIVKVTRWFKQEGHMCFFSRDSECSSQLNYDTECFQPATEDEFQYQQNKKQ